MRPRAPAALELVAVGTGCGALCGAAAGAAVGAFYFLVGAIPGAGVGAVVGLTLGLPLSCVLVAVLWSAVHGDEAARRVRGFTDVVAGAIALVSSVTVVGLGVRSGGEAVWAGVAGLIPTLAGVAALNRSLRWSRGFLVAAWLGVNRVSGLVFVVGEEARG